MKLVREESTVSGSDLNLAQALVEGARDLELFQAFATQAWPRLTIVKSNGVWRCAPHGEVDEYFVIRV